MFSPKIRKAGITLAALGALGLGAGAVAGAADDPSPSRSSSGTATRPHDPPRPEPLTGDEAAKVEAAALEELPGATVLESHAGGPYGTRYHAHVRTSDGEEQVVTVDASFGAVDVVEPRGPMGAPRPRGPHGHPGPGGACDDKAGGLRPRARRS